MNKFSKVSRQIFDLIQQSNHILLHLHPSPDGDSVGSALTMYHYLTSLGKDVHLIKGDSELKSKVSLLPGYDHIELMNYFDLDLSKFDTFIVLDSVSLDRISNIKPVIFPENLTTINLDHHEYNSNFGQINYIDSAASSTCEIIFDLFKDWQIGISRDMAICLYFGIYDDTNGFYNANTSAKCLRVASVLADINPDFNSFITKYKNSNTPDEIEFIKLGLAHTKVYFGGKVAISSLSYRLLSRKGLNIENSKKTWLSEFLRTVPKWIMTISMAECEPKLTGVSLRSSDPKWDISKVAQATGRGGGHPVASGATIYQSAPQALKILLKAIQDTYPELGEP